MFSTTKQLGCQYELLTGKKIQYKQIICNIYRKEQRLISDSRWWKKILNYNNNTQLLKNGAA
jgi:hypothetical protein